MILVNVQAAACNTKLYFEEKTKLDEHLVDTLFIVPILLLYIYVGTCKYLQVNMAGSIKLLLKYKYNNIWENSFLV